MPLSALVLGAALAAAAPAGPRQIAATAPADSAERCAALDGVRIPPARIDLPTGGARVLEAREIAATADPHHPTPDYCRVRGAIAPVDPHAPEIRFELDLPAAWNGKALMMGGGGFDGVIPDTSGALLDEPPGAVSPPLLRGYATFASDSGHQASNPALPTPAVDGAFAMNDEALANYAGDAVKKTRDASVTLIWRRYGRSPARTYIVGGSNGGREALLAIRRWPADFDGAIAAFPFWDAGTNALAFGRISRALAAPGAWLDPARRALVYRAVVAACDGLDGLKDGLVSDVDACRFDPRALRCPPGAEAAGPCLSGAQIGALLTYASPSRFPFRPKGDDTYPAFTALSGAELEDTAQLGTLAPAFPALPAMPLAFQFWDQFVRYAVVRDPSFDSLSLDPQHPGRHAARLNKVVDLLDLKSGGLSAFERRGGKLILYHGLADLLVSHRSTAVYWHALQADMGARTVARFARLYVIPGYGHGAGPFRPVWDPLALLDAWRERGVAPGVPTASDANPAGGGRSRPLCPYPFWPRYEGKGDPRRAASFRCQGP
ncbi:MAG: tannase/feruloyl esterase family alpha/beta hydrolase [Caulobacteraceae bacterium]